MVLVFTAGFRDDIVQLVERHAAMCVGVACIVVLQSGTARGYTRSGLDLGVDAIVGYTLLMQPNMPIRASQQL